MVMIKIIMNLESKIYKEIFIELGLFNLVIWIGFFKLVLELIKLWIYVKLI